MHLLSIDVGIKNLAVCTIEVSDGHIQHIRDWKVINLCQDQIICGAGTRKGLCGKAATFAKQGRSYCRSHALKQPYLLPKNVPTLATLRRKDKEEMYELATKYGIENSANLNKTKLAGEVRKVLVAQTFEPILPRNANTIELPELSRTLCTLLDKDIDLSNISEVVIENQIAPIANRMKCLQSMLTQYFTMRNIPIIKFVSAANKLKLISGPKTTYLQRKQLSVKVVSEFLKDTKSPHLNQFLSSSKKDDLADALLQGMAYLIELNHLENMFQDADYLK